MRKADRSIVALQAMTLSTVASVGLFVTDAPTGFLFVGIAFIGLGISGVALLYD